jgi:succinate dehydrogenase / fumarate reductase membrane anchor subunit
MDAKPGLRAIDGTDTLGSAHAGVRDWRAERLSAIALAPLGLWFLAAFAAHARDGYLACVAWLRQPLSAIAMLLLLLVLFRHLELGLRVIIEDYVHSAAKLPALIAVRLLCLAAAVTGIVAELTILLGH